MREDIVWSVHALARAKERGPSWGLFRALIERAIEAREWDIWYEVDEREGRGLRENLLIRAAHNSGDTYAVVRQSPDHTYVVVSVLTQKQYEFNTKSLWSSTPQGALREHERQEAEKRQGLSPTTRPLTHNPFSKIKV